MQGIERVVDIQLHLGESPLWSPLEQALYWVEVRGGAILRFDPATGDVRRYQTPSDIGALGLTRERGRLLAAIRDGFYEVDLEAGDWRKVSSPAGHDPAILRLNDGRMDRQGRFWCGSMKDPDYGPFGTLYRLDADGTCTGFKHGIEIPNSLCFSPDGKTMYFADTRTRKILAFDYDTATGEIANERVHIELPDAQSMPDGATVDAEGFLWSCQVPSGKVARYDPDGKEERAFQLPVPMSTCCAFGAADLDTLYITTATLRMTDEERRRNPTFGCLYACRPGVKGLPETPFGG